MIHVQDNYAMERPDLIGCQSDTRRRVHRFEQVVDQPHNLAVDVLYWLGDSAQPWIGVFKHLQNSHVYQIS
jgi:hypothetical protein